MLRRHRSALLASALLLSAPLTCLAYVAPGPSEALPDFDARQDPGQQMLAALAARTGAMKPGDFVAGPAAEAGAVREAAAAALEREIGDKLVVRWSPITGSPEMLWARRGFLSAPSTLGFETIARSFLRSHRDLFLMSERQAGELELASRVPVTGGGAMLWFHQSVSGIPVLRGELGIGLSGDGRISHVAGGSVTGIGSLASTAPRRTLPAVMTALAQMAGVTLATPPVPVSLQQDGGADFLLPDFANRPIRVRKVVIPTVFGPQLGWQADLDLAKGPSWYEVVVDDQLLLPLSRGNRTRFADTRGHIFLNNPGNGPLTLERFPDRVDYRSDQSPLGWTTLDLTEGNNVIVRDDLVSDDEATLGRQAQATPPPPYYDFDFPFTDNPAADRDIALVNLFRDINLAHDHFAALGFDEASGNFQVDNRGLGGVGGDPVLGDAQDGDGVAPNLNNANFATPPDGLSGRMQMYLWDISGSKDGSLDLAIIIHEYVHGVSTRLCGGPSDVGCLFGLQGGSMGEAWSDFFAASYLDDPVIGAWVSGDLNVGIRMFALDDNPPAGKDYRNFCTFGNDFPPTYCEPHDNGEIWSGFLWLVRDAFLLAEGRETGLPLVERLVIDGLKFTPCAPSFLDARDAIILADRVTNAGSHECLIKDAAANRWMGYSARSTSGADTAPVTRNDAWPECVSTGAVHFTREGGEAGAATAAYSCEEIITVQVVDGNATGALSVTVTSSGGDRETVTLVATADPAVFTGTLPQDFSAALVQGDGVMEAQTGQTLTASYSDPDQPNPVVAQAAIDCAARLTILRHQFTNTTCDADTVPGFPTLSGFLDRGESADMSLFIANLMPKAIDGSVRITTDRPDLVIVLPETAAVPIHLPAAVGTAPAETVVTVRVLGLDTIVDGDSADIIVTLNATGYDPRVEYRFTLKLNQDYVHVTGLTWTHDIETETTAPVGPDWTTGLLQGPPNPIGNNWTVVTCANTTPAGRRAYRNGPATCAGSYSDAQGDPFLSSPPLTLTAPGTVAVRVVNVAFQMDCDLGSVGIPAFGVPDVFDAEAVALFLVNDPSTIDTVDVFALTDEAIAFYAQLSLLGIETNTTAFQRQSVDVLPTQASGTDLLQPTHLAWVFLTDMTPSTYMGFPFDEQGRGFYIDDVEVTYERVDAVPNAPNACLASTTVFANPFITEPAGYPAVTCRGNLVTVDATGSDGALCGAPEVLEYRFVVGGAPVPCYDDAAGAILRTQDVDGWGLTGICNDFPVVDTTYAVEVRCQSSPSTTDVRNISVRVLDGTPVVDPQPATFCAGSPQTVVLDGSASSMVGCPGGVVNYLFTDAAHAPLDCDGDTNPDVFSTYPICVVGPSSVDVSYFLELQCATLPTCVLEGAITITATAITALGEETNPTQGPYCTGELFDVTAMGTVPSTVTGCAGGTPEYRWRSPEGFDSGWTTSPDATLSLTTSASLLLEVRCSLNAACVFNFDLPVAIRSGDAAVSTTAVPADCAGVPQTLTATLTAPVTCVTGTLEYRFLSDDGSGELPVACQARAQDVDGWGATDTCDTTVAPLQASLVVEVRCTEKLTCVVRSMDIVVTPNAGTPTNTASLLGALRVSKTAGCPTGAADVVLDWSTSSVVPEAFALFRNSDDTLDLLADRLGDVDAATTYSDVGAACDDCAGVTFRGATVYFYVVLARDTCTGAPVP